MKLYQQASQVVASLPLADNAPEQIQNFADQATGQEKIFIENLFEAMYAAASEEQLQMWAQNADSEL